MNKHKDEKIRCSRCKKEIYCCDWCDQPFIMKGGIFCSKRDHICSYYCMSQILGLKPAIMEEKKEPPKE